MPNKPGRGAKYDEDLLVELIAKGELSHVAIAAKTGLSARFVGKVSRGECRLDLKERIESMSVGFVDEARKLGSRAAKMAMATLIELAQGKNIRSETRRKASMDIMAHSMGDPSKPEINVPVTQNVEAPASQLMAKLSPEVKAAVVKDLGGPEEEEVKANE